MEPMSLAPDSPPLALGPWLAEALSGANPDADVDPDALRGPEAPERLRGPLTFMREKPCQALRIDTGLSSVNRALS